MTTADIEVSVLTSLRDVDAVDWDACACPEVADGCAPYDPFTTYRFLQGLELSGSVGPGTGWSPRPLIARADGQIIAVAPLYLKGHSQGEYVFDHSWAHAFEQAGGRYYPKLQVAVPFTPATGRRFLVRPGFERAGLAALTQGAVTLAAENDLSSLHLTFCTEEEAIAGAQMGLMQRVGQQFHWVNQGYTCFDDFLASLSSRKRKSIRRERRDAQGFGGVIQQFHGDDIQPEHWDAFWHFYQDTGARKWGSPYLTRDFFDHLQAEMRDDLVLILAGQPGQWVAGALNFLGRETLYGRYWGCTEHHPFLHFELCYYQAIEIAINRGLKRVEAGAQGEHKLARGYLPVLTHSLHWIGDRGFRKAVEEFLVAEGKAVAEENSWLADFGPFKHVNVEEQE